VRCDGSGMARSRSPYEAVRHRGKQISSHCCKSALSASATHTQTPRSRRKEGSLTQGRCGVRERFKAPTIDLALLSLSV
jgi:hypothetical protein